MCESFLKGCVIAKLGKASTVLSIGFGQGCDPKCESITICDGLYNVNVLNYESITFLSNSDWKLTEAMGIQSYYKARTSKGRVWRL
jgi:hypothetical protein